MATSRPFHTAQRDRPAEPPSPVRVLWLVKGLGPGGAERLLVLAARGRDRAQVAVRVGYLLPHKVALVPDLEDEDVPVACLGRAPLADPRWLLALRRSLIEEPVDVVHAHSPLAAVAARVVLRTLPRHRRPRLVTTEHSAWDGHGRAMRWADAVTCGLDDAHVAVSQAVRASLPRRLRARSEVVLHGVDVAAAQRARRDRDAVRAELGIAADELVVGTVANLRPVKGYPHLFAAARRVLDRHPGVRFVTVGQGPQEDEVRALHRELDLGEGVLVLGHRRDAVAIMGACDVFCLASLQEGLPVALMEALALGLPVVATGVGGITEVVDDGVEGLLVAPASPQALAEAILAVLGDEDLRRSMAAAAAERGAALSIDAAVASTEALYRQLVGR